MIGWIPLELNIWGWTDQRGLDLIRSFNDAVNAEVTATDLGDEKARSSEFTYDVRYDFSAALTLEDEKLDVYAQNLRSIMADLIQAIDEPSHVMRVSVDDAIEAVRIAEAATTFAHPRVV